MPARQGRLNTKYFTSSQVSPSQNASSSRRAGSLSHQKSRQATQAATQNRAREEEDDEDSDGSEAMAAIRLTASPDKRRSSAVEQKDIEVVDIASADENEEERVEEEPVPSIGGSEYYADVAMLDDGGEEFDGIEEVEAPSKKPSNSNGLSPKDGAESVPLNTAPTSSAARKCVPISISSRANPVVPVPTTFTRLRTIDESSATPKSIAASRQLVIELDLLSDEQRALYTIWPASSERQSRAAPIDNVQAFLNAEEGPVVVSRATAQVIHEVSEDEEEEVAPPPKTKSRSHSRISVEIAIRRPKSTTARAKQSLNGSSSSRVNRRTRETNGQNANKSGKKEREAVLSEEDEGENESDAPRQSTKAKGKRRAVTPETDGSDDSDAPLTRVKTPAKHGKKRPKHQSPEPSASKRKERAPSQSQRELLDELELEDRHRFKTQSRLRAKGETAFQRNLRKVKAKKSGIIEVDTDEESEEDGEDDEDDDTSDSAHDSRKGGRPHSENSFIEDDGGVVPDDALPAQFSVNNNQTPEYNFKVVFHYFLLLVIEGSDVLPLKGENQTYFIPQLEVLRRKMRDFRDSRVRSQIWPRNYVNALQAFPRYKADRLESPEENCLACNRNNYKSRFRLRLGGNRYDSTTFRPLESDNKRRQKEAERTKKKQEKKAKAKAKAKKRKEVLKKRKQDSATPSGSEFNSSGSESDSDGDSGSEAEREEEDVIKRGEGILLGTHCQKRSHIYHQMCHWEFNLWNRVQNLHHDLLRAKKQEVIDDSDASPSEEEPDLSDDEIQLRKDKRQLRRDQTKHRVNRLRSTKVLPKKCNNVNDVQEWMDKSGYILPEFKYLDDLQDQSRRLELDRNKDE